MHFLVNLSFFFSLAVGAPLLSRDDNAAVTSSLGLTFYNPSLAAGAPLAQPSAYTCYSGGWSNFPPPSKWASFEKLWDFQVGNALAPIGDSPDEIAALRHAIIIVSQAAKIDARVILAVVTKESTGNVRVGCTSNDVENCGLMQSYDAAIKQYDPNNMVASITQMIRDGTQGTAAGPGLVQLMNDGPNTVVTGGNLWYTLRAYNSGSYDANDLSQGLGATSSYVSDVANFLQGWQGWGSPVRDTCVW